LFGRAGDRRGQAAALYILGQYAWAKGRHVSAEANIRHALKVFAAYHDDDAQGAALMVLGRVLLHQGRFTEADAALVRAGTLARDNENPRLEWRVLRVRATLALARGRSQDALALADRGLVVLRALGDVAWERSLLRLRGEVLADLGRSDEALTELERALRMSRAGDHQNGMLYGTLAISFVLLGQRRLADAERRLDDVERLLETATDRRVTARYLLARGIWHRLLGRPKHAVDALLEARGRLQRDGAERHLEVEVLYALGLAYADAAEHDAAVVVLRRALARGRALGSALPAGLAELVTKLAHRSPSYGR
jgi:tetratricopeptide (TPR) repeat protein